MFKKQIIVVENPKLDIKECQRLLALELHNAPIFEAVVSIIHDHLRDWRDACPATINEYGKLAGNVGAAQALEILRDELVELRARGRAEME